MEIISVVVIVLLFLVYSELKDRRSSTNSKDEKMMLIREITTAIKAPNVYDYNSTLPEYEDDSKKEKELIKDDIVEIDQVEPEVLLRAISK